MGDTQLGKEVTITIPSSAREITVEQYQKWVSVEGDQTFMMLKALEVFANIPLKVAHAMKAGDILDISTSVLTLINQDFPLTRTLTFRGKEFGFIPNLQEITMAEYVDLDTYITDLESLHKVVGILYRPVTTTHGDYYDIEPYDGTEGYKDFPLDVALGATLFFYRLEKELLSSSQSSSAQTERAETTH